MSRLLSGIVIVLFVVLTSLIVGTVSALFENEVAPEAASFTNCDQDEDNYTTCQEVGKGAFLSEVFGATITPFCSGESCSGFAGFLNAIWILVMGLLLVGGVLLILVSFVPTLGN